ncbi:DNA polymerase III subunit delta [Sphingomonas sp. SUN019]|uniref:DNA polymerase III subunit delta n=1 Tax=Sphingomonas sp. SUN019 TaxID=2937788 RepID=UPI0021643D75|nr:DNA polymerase III subunit delta [Sphingomonas sp. SUN019]UVO50988.1 DNA polymerase III subunit delta [Sphingomonas sp. SUN019]
MKAAMDRPPADIRLYLLYGPDEAGAMAYAERLAKAMGPEAERIDLETATLKADPARLADEAAALSLFGGARHIRVTGAGEESLAAVEALLQADRAGNPVVIVAPGIRATGKLAKLALDSPAALVLACYVPDGQGLEAIAVALARESGLRLVGSAARRMAQASGGDRAVMAREIEKLALYLDAAADRPGEIDDAALDAVGADLGEADLSSLIEAVLAGKGAVLAGALRRLGEAGTSPVGWLRQLARRLMALSDMRGEIDGGADVGSVMKRNRVFWKEEAATAAALRRWNAGALARAHAHVRRAERGVMAGGGTVGDLLADHAMVELVAGKR